MSGGRTMGPAAAGKAERREIHIAIGPVGTEGATGAMTSGQGDTSGAKQHHGRRAEDDLARARRVVAPPGAGIAGAN